MSIAGGSNGLFTIGSAARAVPGNNSKPATRLTNPAKSFFRLVIPFSNLTLPLLCFMMHRISQTPDSHLGPKIRSRRSHDKYASKILASGGAQFPSTRR